jgi:hypothetical protein
MAEDDDIRVEFCRQPKSAGLIERFADDLQVVLLTDQRDDSGTNHWVRMGNEKTSNHWSLAGSVPQTLGEAGQATYYISSDCRVNPFSFERFLAD